MKLLGLGDNVTDAYLFRGELYPGGNAANVSVLSRRAGAAASGYLGVVADDAAGRHFLSALASEGVDTSRVRVATGTSACNYITLDDQGDRVFSGSNGSETVQNLLAPVLTDRDRAYAAGFDVIHTSIHSRTDPVVLGGLGRRADLSMDFSSDGFTHDNIARLAPLLRYAFFSAGGRDEAEVRDWAAFAAGCGIEQVVFTMGVRGCCGVCRGTFWQGRAYPVEAVDTLGAGDAFIAAFLTAAADGADAPAAADRAARFAAACCLHYGAFGHPLSLEASGLFPQTP